MNIASPLNIDFDKLETVTLSSLLKSKSKSNLQDLFDAQVYMVTNIIHQQKTIVDDEINPVEALESWFEEKRLKSKQKQYSKRELHAPPNRKRW